MQRLGPALENQFLRIVLFALSIASAFALPSTNTASHQSISEGLSKWLLASRSCSDTTPVIINRTSETTSNDIADFEEIIERRILSVEHNIPNPPLNLYSVNALPLDSGIRNAERDYKQLSITFQWGYNIIETTSVANSWGRWNEPLVHYKEKPPNFSTFDWRDVKMTASQAINILYHSGYQTLFVAMQIAKPAPGTVPGIEQIYHVFYQATKSPYAVVVGEDGRLYTVDAPLGEDVTDVGCISRQNQSGDLERS